MAKSNLPKLPKPDGPSVGSKIAGFFGWFLFIPLSAGICIGFKFLYPQIFPPPKKIEVVEVPVEEVAAPVVKEVKPAKLSDKERAEIAEENGYTHIALDLTRKLIEGASFQDRMRYSERIDTLEQTIADEKNYKVAVKLFEDKNFYAARACLDEILNAGDHEADINELNKRVDLALSVDDAKVEYINGNLDEVMNLLSENDSEAALKLLRLATEIKDLLEMAEGKLERMEFQPAKMAYEEVMAKIENEFHPIYTEAEAQVEALSDNAKLADMLIKKGDKLLNERKYKEVRGYYIRAAEFNEELGKKKIEYFDGLPKLLFKRANENQKTRPMMAYYALKDAFEMAEAGSSFQKQIKNKMVSIAGLLKRYKVEVD